jgi:hypothetical protein
MTTRRRVARAVLSFGALVQIFLMASLPVTKMNSSELQSFVTLAALFAVSVGSAVGLRRWGRESVATMVVGSVFAVYLLLRGAWAIQHHLWGTGPNVIPAQTISVVLAICALAPLPMALIEAWPLGRAATGLGESR